MSVIEIDEYKAWSIVKQFPEELGFILDSVTYDDYLHTYDTIIPNAEPVLTEEEFYIVRRFFHPEENKED